LVCAELRAWSCRLPRGALGTRPVMQPCWGANRLRKWAGWEQEITWRCARPFSVFDLSWMNVSVSAVFRSSSVSQSYHICLWTCVWPVRWRAYCLKRRC